MKQLLKTIIITSFFSSLLAIGSFVGLLYGLKNTGVDFGVMNFLSQYLPEKVIERETIREPQIIEKYIPQTTQEQIIVDIVKKSQDSVVSVVATKDLPVIEQYFIDPFQGFGNDFFSGGLQIPQYRQKGTEKKEVSSGTGFIATSDGLVLTNKHVVMEEGAEFTVIMNNGNKYPAKVLAKDPMQDIAILKIEKTNLPAVKLGDSDSIEVGQTVVAIGNALGEFKNTVSTGVVSGLFRTVTASGGGMTETLDDLIQTDAAINPGNSGGPLFNLSGEVIGINTAMSQGAQNIGFALPINKAKKDLDQVKKTGKISQPFLGVRYILINKEIQQKNNLPVDYGALIAKGENQADVAVVPCSPADKAGIMENDIILEINGKKITKDSTLSKLLQNHNIGDSIKLKIYHKGEEKIIEAILAERK
ncbi:MAG: Protease Do [Parcubacteria group bacterium GW2011_GWC1_38_17]|nr:MAG: Protease Do [Parcubacteria group bacterium GW2011_GWC2_36_17]KKQ43712.1 MAG: Protease Do [Parcubacteria group bacterium GW2011_GWE2_37_8]KKQ58836.1 MAG: Protease Do [Parcubacteria group bacterium GW2011_GWC1_38_17]